MKLSNHDVGRKHKTDPIGVLDSGVGGFTVVRELRKLLPSESITYTADSANCPYGNRSREDILALSQAMIDFLEDEGVKLVLVACNTISALMHELRCGVPIMGIIRPVVREAAGMGLRDVGLLATEFTVSSGAYQSLLQEEGIRVRACASQALAGMVEGGMLESADIHAEAERLLGEIRETSGDGGPMHIVLGCTHYPIIQKKFEMMAPEAVFLNPATSLVRQTMVRLEESGLLNTGTDGVLSIYTSGGPAPASDMLRLLGLHDFNITKVDEF